MKGVVTGKHIVHIVAVEVDAAYIAFEVELVFGLWHNRTEFCHKIIKVVVFNKRQMTPTWSVILKSHILLLTIDSNNHYKLVAVYHV